jgi:hypothetical protein
MKRAPTRHLLWWRVAGFWRAARLADHSPSAQQRFAPACIGGQRSLAQEQKTQQSPGFGRSSSLQRSHS